MNRGRICFENAACLVYNKDCGEDSEETGEKGSYPVPVHRLDKPVSGCLLLAKTADAAAFLSRVFTGERVNGEVIRPEKRYWAISEKPDPSAAGETLLDMEDLSWRELVHGIRVDPRRNKAIVCSGKTESSGPFQKACLRYRLLGKGERYLFLEVDLGTGRRHQIRAQLAAAGFPIKGDLKYGAHRSERGGGIRLHARSLSFPNPLKPKEILRVKADPPRMDPLWAAFLETAGPDR